MHVPKIWMKIIFLCVFFGQLEANIDSKEYFCGKKLVRTLNELCSIYNNPTFANNRFRRQIVEECCRSPCSRRYLVQYYCLEANSSVASLLKAKPENSSKTQENDTKIMQQTTNREEKSSINVGTTEVTINEKALGLHRKITSHGKRNCKCRKRRAKTKKKLKRMQAARNMIQQNYVAPPAIIGHVEHSQRPFYVWTFSRMH